MSMNLPTSYYRCEGSTQWQMGQRVLASPCVKCARRTASRTDGVKFFPVIPMRACCSERLDEEDVVEVYGAV